MFKFERTTRAGFRPRARCECGCSDRKVNTLPNSVEKLGLHVRQLQRDSKHHFQLLQRSKNSIGLHSPVSIVFRCILDEAKVGFAPNRDNANDGASFHDGKKKREDQLCVVQEGESSSAKPVDLGKTSWVNLVDIKVQNPMVRRFVLLIYG